MQNIASKRKKTEIEREKERGGGERWGKCSWVKGGIYCKNETQ